jgi:opacity protein-like surface antigen
MKRVLLIAAIAILELGNVNAQDVKFGAKAGLNLSNVSIEIDGGMETDSKVGYNFGAFAEISLLEKLIFQPELLFSTQGFKVKQSIDEFSFEQTNKMNYLNVPLMFRYAVFNKFGLEVGPQVGFLLSANSEIKETFNGESETFDQDFKDSVKSIDFGLNFGASYDVSENIIIGARYNLGLSNINNEDGDANKINNTVFSFSLGYRF